MISGRSLRTPAVQLVASGENEAGSATATNTSRLRPRRRAWWSLFGEPLLAMVSLREAGVRKRRRGVRPMQVCHSFAGTLRHHHVDARSICILLAPRPREHGPGGGGGVGEAHVLATFVGVRLKTRPGDLDGLVCRAQLARVLLVCIRPLLVVFQPLPFTLHPCL